MRSAKIINNLSFVPRQQHVNDLQLYQGSTLDYHVRLVVPNADTLIVNRHWDFLVYKQTKPVQLDGKCILIHFLEKARAKMAMNRHRSTNYLVYLICVLSQVQHIN